MTAAVGLFLEALGHDFVLSAVGVQAVFVGYTLGVQEELLVTRQPLSWESEKQTGVPSPLRRGREHG